MRCLLPALALAALAAPVTAGPKNVLLVVADDLGMEVGCYGDKAAKTPNIDALAAAGTRFSHGFASVSSCSPSRASIFTGMPTHQSGQYGLAHAEHNFYSFRRVKGLPAILGPAGYKTGVIAKLHVQPKEVYPFDEEIPGNGRNPVQVYEQAKKFIAGCGGKPFFLLIGFTDPHRAQKGFANEQKYPPSVPVVKFDPTALPLPYFIPDRPDARADFADYYQSVARLDHGVGLMMKVLEETKTADDTLVIFLSDNGIPFPGGKTTLYDAGVHLPLIVKKPGQKPRVVTNAMASWTDIAPTVLDWAGLSKPDQMTGRSLLPVLEEEKPAGWDVVYGSHQFHEVTMYYPMRMIRTRTHKLILNLANELEYPSASDLWGSPTWQGVLKRKDEMLGERSVKQFLHRPKVELYDLAADPHEVRNLANDPSQASLVAELRGRLKAWQTATRDPWLIKEKHE
jgi:N-sulfoglucosamine sulfohydrolase